MSAINTTTWSPTSFQLKLAFNPRRSPFSLQFHKVGFRVRVFSAADDNRERFRGDTWAVSSSSADSFSGWSGNDSEKESEKKSWPGGGSSYVIVD